MYVNYQILIVDKELQLDGFLLKISKLVLNSGISF